MSIDLLSFTLHYSEIMWMWNKATQKIKKKKNKYVLNYIIIILL